MSIKKCVFIEIFVNKYNTWNNKEYIVSVSLTQIDMSIVLWEILL